MALSAVAMLTGKYSGLMLGPAGKHENRLDNPLNEVK
jgi:hypothetical protein